jgi:hypothetical protein
MKAQNNVTVQDQDGNSSKPLLVAAFPGTGKSYYNSYCPEYVPEKWSCDSDSSKFDKKEFPDNYIKHIKQRIEDGYKNIFISSHKEVREALVKNGLEFTLVYPDKSLKEEYLKRYKERGSPDGFINLISNNWDLWIEECENQKDCKHIVLESGIFLLNVL